MSVHKTELGNRLRFYKSRSCPLYGGYDGKKKRIKLLSKKEKVEHCRDQRNHELDILDFCINACGGGNDVLRGHENKCNRFVDGAESV